MTDPVQAAIDAAAASAATQTPASAQVPAVQNSGAVATTQGGEPAKKLSMETVGAGTMSVDAWFKVKEFGLLVGDNKELFKTCKVRLMLTDGQGFMPKLGIKGGNPAQYAYTYDEKTANDGKPWPQAIARIQGLDGRAKPYPCVDLPFVLAEDIVVDGKTLAKAGDRLGYTTATTNWANWQQFYASAKEANLLNKEALIELGYQPRSNKNNNTWGVMTFKLLGEFFPEEAAD